MEMLKGGGGGREPCEKIFTSMNELLQVYLIYANCFVESCGFSVVYYTVTQIFRKILKSQIDFTVTCGTGHTTGHLLSVLIVYACTELRSTVVHFPVGQMQAGGGEGGERKEPSN